VLGWVLIFSEKLNMITILEDIDNLIVSLTDVDSLRNVGTEVREKIKIITDIIGDEKAQELWYKIKNAPAYGWRLYVEFKEMLQNPQLEKPLLELREAIFKDKAASDFIENYFSSPAKLRFRYFDILGKIGIFATTLLLALSFWFYKIKKNKIKNSRP